MKNIIKKLLLAFSIGLFVGLGVLISYAVNRTSLLEPLNSDDILTSTWYNDLRTRIINIYSTGSGGNVGIGTSTPTQKLEVVGSIKATTFVGNVTGTASNVPWTGVSGKPTNVSAFTNDAGYISTVTDNRVNATGDNITGNFNVSGNVGIGTTTPSYKLHVVGDIYSDRLRTSGTTGWVSQSWGGGWYMQDTSRIRGYGGKSLRMAAGVIGGDGGLSIGYGGVLPGSGNAIIAGNMGIGTTAPTQKLQVNGFIRAGIGTYSHIILEDDESPNGIKYIHANSNNIGFLSGGGGWLTRWDNAGQQVNTAGITANGIIHSTSGGFMFPNGTVQTTAASAGTLSMGSCYNVVVGEHEAWGMCNTANKEVVVGVYQYTKDDSRIKILYVQCCKLSIN